MGPINRGQKELLSSSKQLAVIFRRGQISENFDIPSVISMIHLNPSYDGVIVARSKEIDSPGAWSAQSRDIRHYKDEEILMKVTK